MNYDSMLSDDLIRRIEKAVRTGVNDNARRRDTEQPLEIHNAESLMPLDGICCRLLKEFDGDEGPRAFKFRRGSELVLLVDDEKKLSVSFLRHDLYKRVVANAQRGKNTKHYTLALTRLLNRKDKPVALQQTLFTDEQDVNDSASDGLIAEKIFGTDSSELNGCTHFIVWYDIDAQHFLSSMRAVVLDPIHYNEIWVKDIEVAADPLTIDMSIPQTVQESRSSADLLELKPAAGIRGEDDQRLELKRQSDQESDERRGNDPISR